MKKSTKEEEKVPTFGKWLPIGVSIIALLVSSVTLWLTKLSPAELFVSHTGRVDMAINPLRADKQLALGPQLLFYNDGAKQGYMRDIGLVFRKAEAQPKQIVLRSVFEILDDTLNLGKELTPPKMSAFNSFPVKGSETVVKKFLFVPEDSEAVLKYETGKYLFTLYTLDAGIEKEWRSWETIEFEVVQGDIEQLNRTTASPSSDGRMFVNWIIQSKPTVRQDSDIQRLKAKAGIK